MKTRRYKKYLIQKGFTTKTIKGYMILIEVFLSWCRVYKVNPDKASLEELYDYQSFNRQRGDKPRTMQSKIGVIKHYYRFIKRKDNPAKLIQTEKPEKKLPKNLLEEQTMMDIYLDCKAVDSIQLRNKTMFGLFIFQGLTRSEIELLETQHIDFEKNRMYVPSTVMTNRRYLALHPIQKRELKQYLNEIRPELMERYNKTTSRLFFSTRDGKGLTDVHNQMLKLYKTLFPELVSFQQLRYSNISMWVQQHGLRKAQYMAGLKNVTSLLRFQLKDKEKLKRKLNVVHPMERLGLTA